MVKYGGIVSMHTSDFVKKNNRIGPDIIIHNNLKDANSSGVRDTNAIFDVKSLRIDKNGHFYSDNRKIYRRAVDTKVMRVRIDLMMLAEKLDERSVNNYTTNPFAEALKNHFHLGGVHPLVFGAFGETNMETERLITNCTKYAASQMENQT